jgi:hypothetical protein
MWSDLKHLTRSLHAFFLALTLFFCSPA